MSRDHTPVAQRHGQQHVLSLMPFVGDGNEFFGIIAEGFEFLEIPAETEHWAVCAESHRADAIVVLGVICRSKKIQGHLPRESVPRFRLVQTDNSDGSVSLIVHVGKFQSNLHLSRRGKGNDEPTGKDDQTSVLCTADRG